MPDSWKIAGYIQFYADDLMVLPVFRKEDQNNSYCQFTFSESSSYFELRQVNSENAITKYDGAPAFPEDFIYFGFKLENVLHFVQKSKAKELIEHIEQESLPDPAKVQLASLRQSLKDVSAVEYPRGVIHRSDFSFIPTLSAQTFADRALSNLKSGADKSEASRKVVGCSRWATQWTVATIPRERLDMLLDDLEIGEAELDEMLREAFEQTALSEIRTDSFSLDLSKLVASKIAQLRRQEMRISQMLRLMILDRNQGLSIAEKYDPRTKYEILVMPLIIEAGRKMDAADQNAREMQVAQLIPKIYIKYFPVRRGRFLVDFLRTLGDFRHVRDQLREIFKKKENTYGVAIYGDVLRGLFREDDEVGLQIRRDVARLANTGIGTERR